MPTVINEDKADLYPHLVSTTGITVVGRTVVVQTIQDRNRLNPAPAFCYVIDATDDPTVDKGSALYVYTLNSNSPTHWRKCYETEMMDFVLDPIGWDDLTIKPNSSPEEIDQSVENSHSHINLSVLSELSDSGGILTYRNERVFPDLTQTFSIIDNRFSVIEESANRHETQLSELDQRVQSVSSSVSDVVNNIDSIEQRLTDLGENTVQKDSFDETISEINNTVTEIQESGNTENERINELIQENASNLETTRSELETAISEKASSEYVNTELDKKVDKIEGKGLSDENFTYDEKVKLRDLHNYDDTWFRFAVDQFVKAEDVSDLLSSNISNADKIKLDSYPDSYEDVAEAINSKVTKVAGKGLSTNDFTNEYKSVIDSFIDGNLASIQDALDNKVDIRPNYNLVSNSEISKLEGYPEYATIRNTIAGKVDARTGMGLSEANFTNEEKNKLNRLENYDDTSIREAIDNKVDKVAGKSLSTNDFTDEYKDKLDSLSNFDPSENQTIQSIETALATHNHDSRYALKSHEHN